LCHRDHQSYIVFRCGCVTVEFLKQNTLLPFLYCLLHVLLHIDVNKRESNLNVTWMWAMIMVL